jgi:hypothetical protein
MNEPVHSETKNHPPVSAAYCPRCGFDLRKERGEYIKERTPALYKAQLILPSILILTSIVVLATGRGSLGLLLLVMSVIWLHMILILPYWRR